MHYVVVMTVCHRVFYPFDQSQANGLDNLRGLTSLKALKGDAHDQFASSHMGFYLD